MAATRLMWILWPAFLAACADSEKPVTFTPCLRVKRRRK